MSYSFGVRAANKAEAVTKVGEELDKVVAGQPIHANDVPPVKVLAEALIGQMSDEDKPIQVSVSGSCWKTDAGVQQLSASVNVSHG